MTGVGPPPVIYGRALTSIDSNRGADFAKGHLCESTMEGCGALRDCRYLLHDRDTKYTQSFQAIIASGQVEPLVLPARSPNLNAYSERWVRSVKEECLSKVVLFGERSLRRTLSEYVEHFHAEPPRARSRIRTQRSGCSYGVPAQTQPCNPRLSCGTQRPALSRYTRPGKRSLHPDARATPRGRNSR
jgi:hypothetical protein